MLKEDVVNNVIMMMSNDLDPELLSKLKICMQMIFYKYDITETNTDIAISNKDDNDEYLKKFAIDLKIEGLSSGTINHYVRETRKCLQFLNKNFRDVKKDDIVYYLAHMSSRGLCNNSLDNLRKYIKSFFTWCECNEYITRNPFLRIKCIKRDEVKKEVLTEHEVVELRDACKTKRELALVDFLNSTGVRVSECAGLKIKDVDFNTGKCSIYAIKTKTWRTVFLDADALKHIVDYRMELTEKGIYSEYLFAPIRSKDKIRDGIQSYSIERTIKNICQRTTITKHITVHTFRKTFASRMYRKGAQPMNIAALLGHKDFGTTAKFYIDINKGDLKYEYDKFMN